jgi:dienelactone hydrolase
MSTSRRRLAASACALLVCACSSQTDAASPPPAPAAEETPSLRPAPPPVAEPPVAEPPVPAPSAAAAPFRELPGVTTLSAFGHSSGLERWRRDVPGVEDLAVRSSSDGSIQQTLFLPPGQGGASPLLVVLHSWSYGYEQHAGIPFAQWAAGQGWAFLHPDFRGRNDGPSSTGSDLAVLDVVDAIDAAIARGGVDPTQVYVLGFSGGGMMSLLVAGRHPDRIAGAVSWVPVLDVADFHRYHVETRSGARYVRDVEAACGGDPGSSPAAAQECDRRSPASYLAAARDAEVPVFVAHGLADRVVAPDHAVRAYNALAAPQDALAADVVNATASNQLPPTVPAGPTTGTGFGPRDPAVVLSRQSGPVRLVLFEGGHDMAYHPGLRWVAELARQKSYG